MRIVFEFIRVKTMSEEIVCLAPLFGEEETKPATPVYFDTDRPLEFVNLLKATQTLVDDTPIYILPQAIQIRTLNLSETAMIDAEFTPNNIRLCRDYPIRFEMRIDDFLNLMPKLRSKRDRKYLAVGIHKDLIAVEIENASFKIPIHDFVPIDGYNVKMFPLPKFPITTQVHVVLQDLLNAVERSKTISDVITFSLDTARENYLVVSSKGEISETSVKIPIYHWDNITAEDKTSYDLRLVLNALKALKKLGQSNDWVKIEFSRQYPVKITLEPGYPITYVSFYIAPKVEKD